MTISAMGRNDPCPCGSGKKFKHCCLDKDNGSAPGQGAPGAFETLRDALAGQEFGTLEEAEAFVARHTRQQNQQPLDEFHGLSPEQMHRILDFPFASPDLVCLPGVLETDPQAPVLRLFDLLAEAIGDKGLKPTARGNLPRHFCREAALTYWGPEVYQQRTRYGGINREEEFTDLHVTRLVAEMAGLIRKYRGRFILGRDCRRSLASDGLKAIYPKLLRTYVEEFNWAYRDGYPEQRFMQGSFLFTLYLLSRHGDTWRSHTFYEDAFLRAFPMVLDEMPKLPYSTPEQNFRHCYTWRTLVNFTGFMGLATVEPTSDDLVDREYRVKALPLLDEAVQFQL